jgi:hypothetical protein
MRDRRLAQEAARKQREEAAKAAAAAARAESHRKLMEDRKTKYVSEGHAGGGMGWGDCAHSLSLSSPTTCKRHSLAGAALIQYPQHPEHCGGSSGMTCWQAPTTCGQGADGQRAESRPQYCSRAQQQHGSAPVAH